MNINVQETKSLWQTVVEWFRGNSRLVKAGEYTVHKRKDTGVSKPERGDMLTGYFTDPKTGDQVFGTAVYLGETETPNYKLLNTVNPEL